MGSPSAGSAGSSVIDSQTLEATQQQQAQQESFRYVVIVFYFFSVQFMFLISVSLFCVILNLNKVISIYTELSFFTRKL